MKDFLSGPLADSLRFNSGNYASARNTSDETATTKSKTKIARTAPRFAYYRDRTDLPRRCARSLAHLCPDAVTHAVNQPAMGSRHAQRANGRAAQPRARTRSLSPQTNRKTTT